MDGRWEDYNRFTPHTGINSLFYWTEAVNLYRFGRSGYCPYIGLGNFFLSRCFFNSLLSLYAYRYASIVTVLSGMFGWLLAHTIWFNQADISWVLAIMLLAGISTTFYVNTFSLQNYNALGWLFFPLGLYGIFTGHWIIAGITFFLMSFGSFTALFMANILCVVAAVANGTAAPIFTVLFADLKTLMHFYPLLIQGNLKSSILSVAKAVGITRRDVKYSRDTSFKKIGARKIYFLFIYAQFIVVLYFMTGNLPVLLVAGFLLFILNSLFMRFADEQSIQMLIFSLATAAIIQNRVPGLLLSYWILASPLPLLVGFPSMQGVFDMVPKLAPFSIKKLVKDMERFLEPVQTNQRVLMAFDDPKGAFEKIFDGYRVLLELPLYVSSKRGIHFMPDWWGVFELNYKGAPHFWGREVDSVDRNINRWKADYAVIYQRGGTELEFKWHKAGFKALSKFSWGDHASDLRGTQPYSGDTPDWWLLKKGKMMNI